MCKRLTNHDQFYNPFDHEVEEPIIVFIKWLTNYIKIGDPVPPMQYLKLCYMDSDNEYRVQVHM